LRHAWPLNVRELDRALAAALALAGGEPIGLEHLPAELGAARDVARAERPLPRPRAHPSGASGVAGAEDAALRDRLVAALELHAGNVSAVARELGKARMQVQRWLRRFHLDPERYR
ncbi:MAG: helix-turn-helix domain-containing protein, partial [Polyangiaceae bacterium]|nr:helix-turn-helix domain-containing protein [Polyangiaceae bacterium]